MLFTKNQLREDLEAESYADITVVLFFATQIKQVMLS